jgi:2-amino-4-hydroxy-6-hydroxymethyldihydropteridine diphosphokinase/dihydropteroate synthase
MGDRVAMIEQACKEMEATGQVKILQTSSLYETKAMYVLDQDNFVNGACEVRRNFFTQRRLTWLRRSDSNFAPTTSTVRLSSISRK